MAGVENGITVPAFDKNFVTRSFYRACHFLEGAQCESVEEALATFKILKHNLSLCTLKDEQFRVYKNMAMWTLIKIFRVLRSALEPSLEETTNEAELNRSFRRKYTAGKKTGKVSAEYKEVMDFLLRQYGGSF